MLGSLHSFNTRLITIILLALSLVLNACTSPFPTPDKHSARVQGDKLDGKILFQQTFNAHGGEQLAQLNDVNVAISGQWETLIKKIQPLVTDFTYRIDSEERILVGLPAYSSLYTGPAGNKKVVRSPGKLEVFYNKQASDDPEVLSSTALTSDAFPVFLLGPLALANWGDQFIRLNDVFAQGKRYHRIHLVKRPGFGLAEEDQLVLWIDPETLLTARVQITLEGHSTTKGAHVETRYLEYTTRGPYTFPTRFYERVKAPIPIGAHAWRYTGLDINRGLSISDIQGEDYSDKARVPAAVFTQEK